MNTYFIIGLIVSLIIRIERAFLRPEFWDIDWTHWFAWVVFLFGVIIDVVLWPASIISEIIIIIYRRQYKEES